MRDFFLAAVDTNAGQINQIESLDLDPGLMNMINSYDGQALPTAAYVMEQKPKLSFTSSAVARALGFVPLVTGLGFTSNDFFFQPSDNGGTRDTTDCVKLSATSGIMCVESIDAAAGRMATISLMSYPTSADGIAEPLAIATGEALSALTTTRQGFTVGPVNINGTLIEGTSSINVRTNVQVIQQAYDGRPYPKMAYILSIAPVITINTFNVEAVGDLGFFAAQGATDSLIYLAKLTENGLRVADATTSHISFSVDDGLITAQRIPAQHGQPATAQITINTVYDGTTAIVVANTASAIV